MKINIVLLFTNIIVFITACSCSSRHSILTFFFDGVPDSSSQVVVKQKIADDSTKSREQILRAKRNTPQFILHGPYQTKHCDECHDTNNGFRVLKKEPELCYDCHSNYEETLENIHGPVSAGFCSECHHPHKSKNKNLLIAKEHDICFNCHEPLELKKSQNHPEIGEENCSICHDPHGSNDDYLLHL